MMTLSALFGAWASLNRCVVTVTYKPRSHVTVTVTSQTRPTTFKTGSNLACQPLWGIGLRRAHPESWRSLGPGTDHGSSCFQALPGLLLPVASNSNSPAFTFNSIQTHTGTRLHFVPSGLLQQCPLRSQLSPPRSTAANPECCRSTRPETTEVRSHFRCHSKRAALAPRASPDRLQTVPPCPKLFGWRGTCKNYVFRWVAERVAKTYGLRAGAICLFLGFARHATVDDPSQSRHPASGIRSPWTYVSYQEIRNNSRRNWRQSYFCNIRQRLCGSISLRVIWMCPDVSQVSVTILLLLPCDGNFDVPDHTMWRQLWRPKP